MSVTLDKSEGMEPTLRLIDSRHHWNKFERTDGSEVYLSTDTGEALVWFEDLDLAAEWDDHQTGWSHRMTYRSQDAFLSRISKKVIEGDAVWSLVWFCLGCEAPHAGDSIPVEHGAKACEDCAENYVECPRCNTMVTDLFEILDDRDEVCERCRNGWFGYCQECSGYFHPDDSDQHNHPQGMCCESPQQIFRIPLNGSDPVSNDTRTKVSIAAGVISASAMTQIGNVIVSFGNQAMEQAGVEYAMVEGQSQWDDGWYQARTEAWQPWGQLHSRFREIGDKWQAKEGNFTKRLSRFAHKEFAIKLPPKLISEVGNIARANSGGNDFDIEFTRDLNMSAEDFGHEESCWWQSYFASRCAFKTNGGFGMRAFKDTDYTHGTVSEVTGRAWVMPLKYDPTRANTRNRFSPTFDTETPDAYVVFNCYGTLDNYTPARVLTQMTGLTYRKVEFYIEGMYINGESGYLVTREEIASEYVDSRIRVNAPQHADLFQTEQASTSEKEIAHV